MTTSKGSLLPKEVTALVHHVELNQSGWWDKSVQRLVLAAVWLSKHPPNIDVILKTLKEDFFLPIMQGKVIAALSALEEQDLLIMHPNGSYRIPDSARVVFEREIETAEKTSQDARDFFTSLVQNCCEGLDPSTAWSAFESEFLTPLINEVGSNAYHLIAGEKMIVDKRLVDHFLKGFESTYHRRLRDLVIEFLDPKKDEVRAYISRRLHARFCVEASGLSDEVIEKIKETIGKQVEYRVFVDTNFLFSLLDLHDNPSNAAARELQELINQLKSNLKIQMYIIPPTVQEAKRAISSAKYNLSGVHTSTNFTQAALNVGFSGMAKKFFSERLRLGSALSAADWFDPYLNNFVAIAREKGVEFVEEDLSPYSTRQDVVDDLHYILDAEKRRPPEKRKTYEKIAHDMVLWHFASDQRPAYIESPIDAKEWILTVDFRLISFDQIKQAKSETNVPLCLHPTSLIQLLQFWVPRTKEFEEAMLGSMRLPFLFQGFDVEAERTSLKILKGLGRYEGREDISEQTITRVILNDGLRSRLKSDHSEETEAEIALIRDALVEEMKTRVIEETKITQHLKEKVQVREEALSVLDAEVRIKTDEIQIKNNELELLRKKVVEEESRRIAADKTVDEQGAEITELKSTQATNEENTRQAFALLRYLGLLTVLLLISGLAAWWADVLMPSVSYIIGPMLIKLLTAVIVFVVCHLLLELCVGENSRMARLWPFRQTKKFRKWLWTVVVIGSVFGFAINIHSNNIQKNLDKINQQDISQNAPSVKDSARPQN